MIYWIRYLCLFLLWCGAAHAASSSKSDRFQVVYLTWKERPDTSMVVQWVTSKYHREDGIEYRPLGTQEWLSQEGRHKVMPEDLPYMVHRVELSSLAPNTVYEFRTPPFSQVYKFKTMPTQLDQPIRFVAGGDMYHDDIQLVRQANQQAAVMNPSFVLVGGDIAYAASNMANFLPDFISGLFDDWFGQKADRWMDWLVAWSQDMVTRDGVLIPMVPVLGNHDVNGRFEQSPEDAPFFYTLFAFPGRQGYGVLDFGRYMSVIALDSGHTHSVGGKQTDWLELTLRERKNIPWKFALYHVPAFPSNRSLNAKMVPQIRRHWVPLFEEYHLTTAFENHDHTYKRTYRIRDNAIDPTGVLYLGDGAWGVAKPRQPKTPEQRWYIANSASKRHFILATVTNTRADFEAVDADTGEIFDSTSIFR